MRVGRCQSRAVLRAVRAHGNPADMSDEAPTPPSDTPADSPADTPAATLPDRLSTQPDSPFYDEAVLSRNVGVRFKGEEKTNVDEYCVSEGWVRLSVGTSKDRRGNPLTVKLSGPVEPYFRND